VNRIRSIRLAPYLLVGLVMLVVSGCVSEQEQIDNYRDRIGPAYEAAREAQDEFETSLRQTVNLNTAESSAIDSLEVVSARATKFQTSAGILVSILESEKPLDRCADYNSVMVDLMKAYSGSVDLVIEELESLSNGVTDSVDGTEIEAVRLGDEINQLITEIPAAEIDCFVVE
jgi:hypothetical protein